jgi:sodium-dependent dicarboxylate transporter 2/3/5
LTKLTPRQLKLLALLAGPIVALLIYLINPFAVGSMALKVLAVGGLMITWWISEALPMPVVALLPLILFPLLKINSLENTAAP